MRKIFLYFFSLTLVSSMLFSCEKETLSGGRFRASLEGYNSKDAKVSFNLEDGFQWQNDDQILATRVLPNAPGQVCFGTYTIDQSTLTNLSGHADFVYTQGVDVTTQGVGNYFVYYPADLRSGSSNGLSYNDEITIKRYQTATPDGKMQGFPMYSESETAHLTFKNLCGILRLHLIGNTGDAVSMISINTDDSHPVSGYFLKTTDSEGNPMVATTNYNPSPNYDVYNPVPSNVQLSCPTPIDISGDGSDFLLYLPVGDYPRMGITITTSDGRMATKLFDPAAGSKDAPTSINIARSRYSSVTLSNLNFQSSGFPFTINSNGDQVLFSPGNLEYDMDNQCYQFANTEYSCIGSANRANLTAGTGVIDLFGWGTGGNPTLDDDDNSLYPTSFDDWGHYSILNGSSADAPNTWHTLTSSEWLYIFNSRTGCSTVGSTANARYVKVLVDGKKCVVIFPDDYTHPADVSVPANINEPSDNGWSTSTGNIYSVNDYAKMHAAGAVFLPNAGYLNENHTVSVDNPIIRPYSDSFCYWSSGSSSSNGTFVNIWSRGVRQLNKPKKRGCSVRLVRDVN